MKPIFKELGTLLKKRREELGIPQVIVARKLGYTSAQSVSSVERHVCSFPLHKLKKVIEMYQLSHEDVTQMILRAKAKEVRRGLGLRK